MTMGDRIAVMREGILQQVAPPQEIYGRPANMYVAGFIGSPKMNFIPISIEGDIARASGFDLRLPAPLGNRSAILGIRPENLGEHRVMQGPRLEMKVDVLEVLGSDQFLYGKVGRDEVVARVDPHLPVGVGDTVPLGVDVRRLHLFDPGTEEALR
jgi:multiple sugar transport system ATP-binding protein